MAEVTGIDHLYITVSTLGTSETFYDRVMIEALGFRKNNSASFMGAPSRQAPPQGAIAQFGTGRSPPPHHQR